MGICFSKSSACRNQARSIRDESLPLVAPEPCVPLPHLLPVRGASQPIVAPVELIRRSPSDHKIQINCQTDVAHIVDDSLLLISNDSDILCQSLRSLEGIAGHDSFELERRPVHIPKPLQGKWFRNLSGFRSIPGVDHGNELNAHYNVENLSASQDPYPRMSLRVVSVCFLCADMFMDGGVEVQLYHEGFYANALLIAASVVMPQILAWVFLRSYHLAEKWALLRTILCPCISACLFLGLWLWDPHDSSCWKDIACFFAVVSFEPWYLLKRCWKDGSEIHQLFGVCVAEGISAIFTLYVALSRSQPPSVLLLTSVLTSMVTCSWASTSLHYYGEKPSWLEQMTTLVLMKFPRVSSRVLGYAFFAFACRSLGKNTETLQEHNETFLVWTFLLLEVCLNVGLVWNVAPRISASNAMFLACTMTFGGPPGFLRILHVVRPSHGIQQLMILLLMTAVSVTTSSREHFQQVTCLHYTLFVLFVAATLVAVVGDLVTNFIIAYRGERSEQARCRLDQALVGEDVVMVGLLVELGGARLDKTHIVGEFRSALPHDCFIDAGKGQGIGKWWGVTESNSKLFFCPFNATEVMVRNLATGAISFIDVGRGKGGRKWQGIIESHGKLYCCPSDAEEILVIDAVTETISFIATGKDGCQKWRGIAKSHGKLYCCPCNAAEVMVIDPATGTIAFIDTGKGEGGQKWCGIAESRGELYCCPSDAAEVMVIDPNTEAPTFMDIGREQGGRKWRAIAESQGKLYCSPCGAAEVLVIDAATKTTTFIDTGKGRGCSEWLDIAEIQGKLYFCPYNAAEVMVLDLATESVAFIDTGKGQGGAKWSGITQSDGKLYFSPFDSAEVMVIDPAAIRGTRADLFDLLCKRAPKLRRTWNAKKTNAKASSDEAAIADAHCFESIVSSSVCCSFYRRVDWIGMFSIQDPLLFGRLLCVTRTFLLCTDIFLDGGVEVHLLHDGFCSIAIIMATSIVMPHVLTWFFLRAYQMTDMWALVRTMLFPCISACLLSGFWLLAPQYSGPWKDAAVFIAGVSLEPLHLLKLSWNKGKETPQSLWTRIAEGMIEAPCSCILTLYVALLLTSVQSHGPSMLFLASIIFSLVSISCASTSFNYYGQGHYPWREYVKTLVLTKFPHVASQVLGYAFFAFASRPLAKNMEDLQHHNESFLVWFFMLLEISLNACMVWTLNANMSVGNVMMLACAMAVAGPPSFLHILDAARPAHAIQHLVILLAMAAVSMNVSSRDHFHHIICYYPAFFVLFVATALIAFVSTFATIYNNPAGHVQRARRKLDLALLEQDDIKVGLLIELEGVDVNVDRTHLIMDASGECFSALPDDCFIDSGKGHGGWKWCDLAASHSKLYCCPSDAAEVMIIDPVVESISFIDATRGQGSGKWRGIAECNGKLYCCPSNAVEVMVIDPVKEVTTFIDTGKGEGGQKWHGIAESHGKLYCCPGDAAEVLVLDPATDTVSFIDSGREGSWKWSGIAECSGKLYCCPLDAAEVLVIDPATDTITYIDSGKGQECGKWRGIIESQGKLYCCPWNAADVMVIDPAAESITFIDIGKGEGGQKWQGIAESSGKLYCCPCSAAEMMVLDLASSAITFIDAGKGQAGGKWRGVAESQGKLYCCPFNAPEILKIPVEMVKDTRGNLFESVFDRLVHLHRYRIRKLSTHFFHRGYQE